MGFATRVKDNSDFKSFPRTLKDGVTRCRVLPGIHSCSEDGTWSVKYSTHTYAVPSENDAEKKDYKTFTCVEVSEWVNRERVIIETCPECSLIADHKLEYDGIATKLKEDLKNGLKTKDEVRKMLRPYIDWAKRHSRSFWWAVNVVDSDGKYRTDKWPNDVKKLFDAMKKKLKDEEGIGAILPLEQGVWVDITKIPGSESGTGFPKYELSVVYERQADGSKREKLAPLTLECGTDAEKACWDINDPGVIHLTREQVKMLASSGDSPPVLRGVFGMSQKAPVKIQPKPEPKVEAEPVVESVVHTEAPKATPTVEESEDDRIQREALAAIAALQAKREASKKEVLKADITPPVKVEVKPEVKTPPPAKKAEDDDMKDFMREFELS